MHTSKDDKNGSVVNVLMSGVGGQGVLIASDILSEVAMNCGYDVKKSEVHGMAQRGGSVVSHVRFGKKIYAPLIRKNGADFLLAFEKLEALRYLDYLKDGGVVIINDLKITPMTVHFEGSDYPENVVQLSQRKAGKVIFIAAYDMAKKLGNYRIMNVLMLGILSNFLDLETEVWLDCIRAKVPTKTVESNIRAFDEGRKCNPSKNDKSEFKPGG